MIEDAGCPCFLLKSGEPVAIARDGIGKDLDGDVAADTRILRTVDPAHPAGAEFSENLVRSDARRVQVT